MDGRNCENAILINLLYLNLITEVVLHDRKTKYITKNRKRNEFLR